MRKNIIFVMCLALFVLFYTNSAYSQFRLKLGPSIGLNYNIHTGSDLPQSGSGFGFLLGGQADMSFTPNIGLIANMQFYDNRSGSFTQTGSNQYQDQQTGNLVSSTVSTDNSSSLAYFDIEALFKYSLSTNNLFFFAGPSVGFNIEGSYNVTRTETFPSPYQNNNTTNSSKGSFQNLNTRFELKFGSGYDIPAGSIFITPQLSFGYGLTEVEQNINWRILTIQAMVTVKFGVI